MELRAAALKALLLADPVAKATATRALQAAADLTLDTQAVLQPDAPLPGRPLRPRLVPASALPRRTPFTTTGRAALLHAVAHIEFNAIKMADDASPSSAQLPTARLGICAAGNLKTFAPACRTSSQGCEETLVGAR